MQVPETELPSEHFEVWEENWPAVEMFLRCQTQWRTSMNGVVGLDYGALAWVFKMYAVEDPRELLEDLQVMEVAVLSVLKKRSD